MVMLQKKHFDVMQLKYQGLTYPEIAKRTKVSANTLEGYFQKGGLLEFEYESFMRDQNRQKVKLAVELFKQNTELASQTMNRVLQRAVKAIDIAESKLKAEVEGKARVTKTLELERALRGAENRAFEFAQVILDRGGLPVITKIETETKDSSREEEEAIDEQLRRAGIDPDKIQYRSQAPEKKSRVAQA